MSEYNVRAGDNDSSYGTFSTLDPEARIVVKYDWRARRPHWTDDLLAEVGNAIADIPAYDWQAGTVRDAGALLDDYIGHIYAIIAAVEDWQDKQIIGCRYACVGSQGAEIAELRAQIQRAREVLNRWVYRPPLSLLDEVTRALDGDSDD